MNQDKLTAALEEAAKLYPGVVQEIHGLQECEKARADIRHRNAEASLIEAQARIAQAQARSAEARADQDQNILRLQALQIQRDIDKFNETKAEEAN